MSRPSQITNTSSSQAGIPLWPEHLKQHILQYLEASTTKLSTVGSHGYLKNFLPRYIGMNI